MRHSIDLRRRTPRRCAALLLLGLGPIAGTKSGHAQAPALDAATRARIEAVEPSVIAWRRDIHEHPELGNREVRTAGLVADHLRSLGLEVRTGVAHTDVVGVLRGSRPGPVVLLRADMDALPVTEPTGLPFASTARSEYGGEKVVWYYQELARRVGPEKMELLRRLWTGELPVSRRSAATEGARLNARLYRALRVRRP